MASGLDPEGAVEEARRAWQESMERRLDELRDGLKERLPASVAERCGARLDGTRVLVRYWDREVSVTWPGIEATDVSGTPCSTFDSAMLMYFLQTADGSPAAGRWISFRELPDGGFYHQAFQGYSGDRIARAFSDDPAAFEQACQAAGGERIIDLSAHAFCFLPFDRIALAVSFWPGDEELAGRASVLFDAAASRYLPTDGLALLGSGLASRLLRAGKY